MLVAPGVLFSAIGRVTLPSPPVSPIAAAPPTWMKTGLPATSAAPAFSCAVTFTVWPNVPLAGRRSTRVSDVAAAAGAGVVEPR